MQYQSNLNIRSKLIETKSLKKIKPQAINPLKCDQTTEITPRPLGANEFQNPDLSSKKFVMIPKININFKPNFLTHRDSRSPSPYLIPFKQVPEESFKPKENFSKNYPKTFREVFFNKLSPSKHEPLVVNSWKIKLSPIKKSVTPDPR